MSFLFSDGWHRKWAECFVIILRAFKKPMIFFWWGICGFSKLAHHAYSAKFYTTHITLQYMRLRILCIVTNWQSSYSFLPAAAVLSLCCCPPRNFFLCYFFLLSLHFCTLRSSSSTTFSSRFWHSAHQSRWKEIPRHAGDMSRERTWELEGREQVLWYSQIDYI